MPVPDRALPPWAEELRRRYLRGEAWQFVLHGNVHDLVLHGGRLVELGTHRALLDQGGRYAHLFQLQAQGYLD